MESSSQSSACAKLLVTRIRHVFPKLARVAAGVMGTPHEAEDIVQQAIAIAIEKNQDFESERHFVGWLVGVTRNCANNALRKRIRRKTEPTDPGTMLVESATAPAEKRAVDVATGKFDPLQSSFDDRLQSALLQISANARTCLLLRIVDGLDYKEISKLMNIPEGTAMNLVHRSKKKLRELLSKGGASESEISLPSGPETGADDE